MYKSTIACCVLLLSFSTYAHEAIEGPTASEVVALWLSALDQQDYELTWKETAPVFRKQVTLKDWKTMAKKARKPFGEFRSRELLGGVYQSSLPGVGTGDYIVFQYRSSFETTGGVIETITPMLVNGHWQVSGYYVR